MKPKPEVVISGVTGRFPQSDNLEEYEYNLYNGIDMVTADDTRWRVGLFNLPPRNGKLKSTSIERFDNDFFEVPDNLVNYVDPQERIFLELVYEAISDASYRPSELQGKRTGFYWGACFLEVHGDYDDPFRMPTQTFKSYIPRVMEFYHFQGPLIHSDTACNSSLNALNEAVLGIKAGLCDRAIVVGSNTCFRTLVSLRFRDLKMISKDGICKCLDESANGYCRSEGIVAILIERKDLCKRIYAEVVNTKSGSDGFKEEGITFPSMSSQRKLAQETYDEIGINPADIGYIEAHVTGTAAGDPVEMQAMYDVICSKKKPEDPPLLVGCVKSSIGHAEGASGLCSIAKACLVLQKRLIPPNIHFNKPNPVIKGLMEGKMIPVTEVTPLPGELIPVNSFGFGGANTHVVLKGIFEERDFSSDIVEGGLPRLVLMCGRIPASIQLVLNKLKQRPASLLTRDFLFLLNEFAKNSTDKMSCRSYTIVRKVNDQFVFDDKTLSKNNVTEKKAIRFHFSPFSNENFTMDNSFLQIPSFREAIEKFQNITERITSLASQLALIDTLKAVNIKSQVIESSSSGNGIIAQKYFEGAISFEEAVKESLANFRNSELKCVTSTSPSNIILDISPRGVSITNGTSTMTANGHSGSFQLLRVIGELYCLGFDVRIDNFYPLVKLPLPSSTPTLSSLILWDHRKIWSIKPFLVNDAFQKNKLVKFYCDRSQPDNAFLYDHRIDERILFPATGYLMLVWIAATKFSNTVVFDYPVQFSNVSFSRATVLDKNVETCICTRINGDNGDFFVMEGDNVVVTGNIKKICRVSEIVTAVPLESSKSTPTLSAKQIYREFRVRGYDYGPYFQGILDAKSTGLDGQLIWRDVLPLVVKEAMNIESEEELSLFWLKSWVTFVDAMFQLDILREDNDSRSLFVPTRVESITCIPDQVRQVLEDSPKFTDSLTLGQSSLVKVFRGHANTVFCPGLVVKGLKTTLLKRKPQQVTQFKVKFTPFFGASVIPPQDEETLEKYVEACLLKQEAVRGMSFDLNDKKCSLLKNIITESTDPTTEDQLIGELNSDTFFRNEFLHPLIDTVVTSLDLSSETDNNPFDVLEVTSSTHILGKKVVDFWPEILLFNSIKLNYTVVVNDKQEDIPPINRINIVDSVDSIMNKLHFIIVNCTVNGLKSLSNLSSLQDKLQDRGFLLICIREEPYAKESRILFSRHSKTSFTSSDAITKLVTQGGFLSVRDIQLSNLLPLRGLLFRKIDSNPSISITHRVIEVGLADYSRWFEDLKLFLREENDCKDKRLWIVNRIEGQEEKQKATGITGLVKSLRLEEGGERLRVLLDFSVDKVDLDNPKYKEVIERDMVYNVWDEDTQTWGFYQSIHLPPTSPSMTKLSDNSYLRIIKPGDLTSFAWVENDYNLTSSPSSPHTVKVVNVSHAALNFRDVMFATGQLDSEAIPGIHPNVAQDSILGLEFSGLLEDGERVMGITPYKGMATKVSVSSSSDDSDFLWSVPPHWSLEEAATVPVVYATAYYALIIRGQLSVGESVLIHSGCGGVGLAALNICLSMGCRVFTTCGSRRKRDYLLKNFPSLSNSQIFNSRDTTFEEDVLKATSGKGVDVVLNSLSEDKLQASLRCLSDNGRFLEIGKVDFVRNHDLFTHQMTDNKSFHGVLLDALFEYSKSSQLPPKIIEEKRFLKELLSNGVREGVVRPLDRTVFSASEVESAFRFMASGKHIGKVLIKVRDENNNLLPSLKASNCYENKVYIILGGLGGFGLELTMWLAYRGAKNLVVVSRSGIRDSYQQYCVDRLKKKGHNVVVSTADVTKKSGCEELLKESMTLGPVGGIFNTAVVYKDSLYQDQSASQFREVCGPKSEATRHLDLLSRDLCPQLDYFVTFSSISANRGNAGQTNYNFSNSAMDSICIERWRRGLPALSIQWGVVGDVGIVADSSNSNDMVLLGSRAQRMHSCFDAINRFLSQEEAAVCLSYIKADPETGAAANNESVDILSVITRLLGLKDMSSMDPEITLGGLGVDSLIAVEIKQALDKSMGSNISVKEVRNLSISTLMSLSKQQTSTLTTES